MQEFKKENVPLQKNYNMRQEVRRHIALWLLLAVFMPMLIFSSLHVHEVSVSATETECTDCIHHNCHGHLTQIVFGTHDCVLCQFLTLSMLTATAMAAIAYFHVCKKNHVLPLGSCHAACCGIIVTRGPPSV